MLTTSFLKTGNITVTDVLQVWLTQRVTQDALKWLDTKYEEIAIGANVRVFFAAFSAVPRYTGKQDLNLTNQDLEAAAKVCKGWFPNNWTLDQAARILLLQALPSENADVYLQTLDQLFNAVDMGELIALYQALPLLPHPEKFQKRAAEGIRSNITAVFNAIALNNPYPSLYLDNLAWNQMVLKALFVSSPLNQIQGLQQRANPQLSQMLTDYASERQAAKRTVPPEIWELVKYGNDR
jgi:hypothetical protein